MSRLPAAYPQGFDASLPVSEQAFFWVVFLEAGVCSDADHNAFDDWLDADDGHGPAYREAAQLWRTLAASPRVDALPAAVMDVRPRRTAPRRRVAAGIAGAALLAASLGIGLLVMPRLGAELGGAAQTDYASVNYDTAIGEIRRVVLADGSELVLGGDTALEVRFTETGRQASILKGQVFLDVVHEPARPFAITAGRGARPHSWDIAGYPPGPAGKHGVCHRGAGRRRGGDPDRWSANSRGR
ncbi:MAG: FecR domain-containing protein [Pararhodobacter sp.]